MYPGVTYESVHAYVVSEFGEPNLIGFVNGHRIIYIKHDIIVNILKD